MREVECLVPRMVGCVVGSVRHQSELVVDSRGGRFRFGMTLKVILIFK
jgi:hypothetical protein